MSVKFSSGDHEVWRTLYSRQAPLRDQQIVSMFSKGLEALKIGPQSIPNIEDVNLTLSQLTGWSGIYVQGFKEATDFFKLLSEKKFPIGSFIRCKENLSYTPEPDVFHDLYGHLPFYANKDYANFSEEIAKRALKYSNKAKIIEEFQRLFWFTLEFGLIKTKNGRKIFGAGIASSFQECAYALSNQPKVMPFSIEKIRCQYFRIDELQSVLFEIEDTDQLYLCLDDFEKPYLEEK